MISAGYPIIELGKWTFKQIYGQTPPAVNSTSWWLSWFPDALASTQGRAAMQRLRDSGNLAWSALVILQGRGHKLAAAEEKNPAYKNKEPKYSLMFGGRDTVGLSVSESDWHTLVTRAVGWVCAQMQKGNLDARYLDALIHHMILADHENRRLPNWLPPSSNDFGAASKLEQAAWDDYLQATGWNAIVKSFFKSWHDQSEANKKSNVQWLTTINAIHKGLSYASLQEPAIRLQELTGKLFKVREQAHSVLRAAERIAKEFPDALAPSDKAAVQNMAAQVAAADKQTYDALSVVGLWQGAAPSGLGVSIVPIIVYGAIAVALCGTVVALSAIFTDAVADGRKLDLATKATLLQKDRQGAILAEKQRRIEYAERMVADGQWDAPRAEEYKRDADADASRAMGEVASSVAIIQAEVNKGTAGIVGLKMGAGTAITALAVAAGIFMLKPKAKKRPDYR